MLRAIVPAAISFVGLALGCIAPGAAAAQDLTVYADTLQAGFQDYSFGDGSDFANTQPVHAGTKSIAFTGNAFNAVSFAHLDTNFATAQYAGLRLWLHGGATGNQQLRLYLQLDEQIVAQAELDTYIEGGAPAAGTWREVTVAFASAPLAYSGSFDRIDFQSDVEGGQPTLYLDDVALLAANVVNGLFSDGFENVALPAGQLRFAASVFDAIEDQGGVAVTVERVGGSAGAVSVQYATANGSATQPGDYASASGTLNWANGDTTPKTFVVDLVDDGVAESQESVVLSLSGPTGATLGAPSTAAVHLTDPELLFVPQYTGSSIKIWRRTVDGFAFVRTAPLPAGSSPNALAFAPDGKLWVVDNGAVRRLLRYSRQAIVEDGVPAAEVAIGPIAGGDIFALAFFGDFAYVTQSDFGATDRVLKYSLAQLGASGNPAPALLSPAGLDVPAGIAFDPEGRLWVSNYGNNTLVRMNASSGVIDRTGTLVAVGDRNSLNTPEGLAFDENDTLWVGNNGEPTISGFAGWQIADAGEFAAAVPVHQIDVDPELFAGDTVGGLAFDREGDLWANYQKTFEVLEYRLMPMPRGGALPGVGSYQSTAGQALAAATTFPGFGGIAFWPSPTTLYTQSQALPFRGTNLVGMEMSYAFDQVDGPEVDQNYVAHDERLIDYFAGKGIGTLRFLFSWEGMQSQLFGPIPAANDGNYKAYYDNYLRIVDYATNTKGMKVIVEPWQANSQSGAGGARWRGDLVGTAQVPTAAFADFWTKMATILKDNPRVSFGLVNEPNQMSTMTWWAIAQAGVTAIRNSGATNRIYVPGNGYSAASTWVSGNYDGDPDPQPKRSNAYGWLNANGPGQPIFDPLDNIAAEVHTYLNLQQSGFGDDIVSITAARDNLAPAVAEGRARGYRVYLGEIGMNAANPIAADAWADFIAYFEANPDELEGFSWWAGGDPDFWALTQGPFFSISPTSSATYTGDTVNMDMIEDFF